MVDTGLSLKHVRKNCLECSGGSARYVTWCSADGLHSTHCEFWPFRFGLQPATFRQRLGDRLLTPEAMPPAGINLDRLPGSLEEAATAAIDVEGTTGPRSRASPGQDRTLPLKSARRSPRDSDAAEKRPASRKSHCPDNAKIWRRGWDGTLVVFGSSSRETAFWQVEADREGAGRGANLAN